MAVVRRSIDSNRPSEMLKEHARTVTAIVMILDLAVVAGAFLAAHWLRAVALPRLGIVDSAFFPLERYLPLLPAVLLLWGGLLLSSGEYRSHRTVGLWRECGVLARVSLLGAGLLVLAVYLLRIEDALLDGHAVSRAWIALLTVLAFAGLFLVKLALRVAAATVRRRGYNFRTILILGTGDSARSIADSLQRHRYWGYKLKGFLAESPDEVGGSIDGVPVLGTVDDLDEVVVSMPIDEVVCATRNRDEVVEDRILERLRELGICARFALGPAPRGALGPRLSELDGVILVTYASVPARLAQLMLKRLADLTIASLLLLLLAPVIGAVSLVILLLYGRPVLFRQLRVGLNGRRFTLFKFRTMEVGAEARRGELEHLNEMDGPAFKIRRDPRVTPLGRFLRRTSLDELPQLWNVLIGEMSLVGPRPLVEWEVARLERWQRRRLSMRPGLTCLWQVEGRNDLDWNRWVELDMQYIDTWSPWLDFKILLRTIPAVVSGRGAS